MTFYDRTVVCESQLIADLRKLILLYSFKYRCTINTNHPYHNTSYFDNKCLPFSNVGLLRTDRNWKLLGMFLLKIQSLPACHSISQGEYKIRISITDTFQDLMIVLDIYHLKILLLFFSNSIYIYKNKFK